MKDKIFILGLLVFAILLTDGASSRTLVMPGQINMSWENFNLSIGTLTAVGDIILEGNLIEIRGGFVNGSLIPSGTFAFDLGNTSNRWGELYINKVFAIGSSTFGDNTDVDDITIIAGIRNTAVGRGVKVEDDIELMGNLNISKDRSIILGKGGNITTFDGGNLTLIPDGVGFTIIGDAGAPDKLTPNNDDLFISGELEVDGIAWFDNNITLVNGAKVYDNATCLFLESPDGSTRTEVCDA